LTSHTWPAFSCQPHHHHPHYQRQLSYFLCPLVTLSSWICAVMNIFIQCSFNSSSIIELQPGYSQSEYKHDSKGGTALMTFIRS
jgi:hypothetical protein